jgi:putative acetyltransferase
MITIHTERSNDVEAIRQVHIAAFNRVNEANLVDALRNNHDWFLSLVAVVEDSPKQTIGERVVANICFSPITIEPDCSIDKPIVGLAPLAVLPEFQRQGIGSLLVRSSLQECNRLDIGAVLVLGHSSYYPRFGFIPGKQYGLSCEYDVPDDVFMVLELQPGILRECRGVVKYAPEFAQV